MIKENDKKMMQHKRGISALLVGFIVLCIMICGCVDSKASIIGKWERVDADVGKVTMEFFKDGTITIVSEDPTLTGDYTFVDDDHIRIELGGLAGVVGPYVCNVAVSKDTLILTGPKGESHEYRRV